MPMTGGCRCGACRYTIALDAVPQTYACHCLHCQTMTGSAFVLQAPMPEQRLATTGDLVTWEVATSDGQRALQRFCARCMTRLYSTNSGRPGVVLLRAGTLDGSQQVMPALHIWTSRRQPWIGLPADAESYAEGAPPGRMRALFARNAG